MEEVLDLFQIVPETELISEKHNLDHHKKELAQQK